MRSADVVILIDVLVLLLQLSYKPDQLPVNHRPADSSRLPYPVRLEASFVPANNTRGLDDNQR